MLDVPTVAKVVGSGAALAILFRMMQQRDDDSDSIESRIRQARSTSAPGFNYLQMQKVQQIQQMQQGRQAEEMKKQRERMQNIRNPIEELREMQASAPSSSPAAPESSLGSDVALAADLQAATERQEAREALQARLDEAVKREDYSKAASLKKELDKLES